MSDPVLMTCTYFLTGKRVYMAQQQRKVIGLKGYGGKLKPGETWHDCCDREIRDESGGDPEKRIQKERPGGISFLPRDLVPFALISFYNGTAEAVPPGSPSCTVLFSKCSVFSGSPIDTDEMMHPRLYWINRLPYTQMISGDFLFITPASLLGTTCLRGTIRHTADLKTVIEHALSPCLTTDLTFDQRPL